MTIRRQQCYVAVTACVILTLFLSSGIQAIQPKQSVTFMTPFSTSLYPLSYAANISVKFAFTTHFNQPPYEPSTPTPVNGATDQPLATSLSWVGGDPDVDDTVTYDVFFGTATPLLVASNISLASYDPGLLDYNQVYNWQIVSWDNHNASTTGPLWTFSTHTEHAPDSPTMPFPGDTATNIPITTTLSWISTDPDPEDTVTCDVYFGTTITPPLVVANTTLFLVEPGHLQYGITYYWRIVAWDQHGYSRLGPLWSFTTHVENAPYTPNSPSPVNGAINVSLSANLTWLGGDPDIDDTVTYDLYFGTTTTPAFVASNLTETNFTPTLLASNTHYYWSVIAWDSHSESTHGPLWSFTTLNNSTPNNKNHAHRSGSGNSPPFADIHGPYHGFAGIPVSFNATGSRDLDGYIAHYDWKFSATDTWLTLSATPTFTFTAPGNYTISLRVTDNTGLGTVATTYAIITNLVKPLQVIMSGPSKGLVNVTYVFEFSSHEQSDVAVHINWGDNVSGDFIIPGNSPEVSVSHKWSSTGKFMVSYTAASTTLGSQASGTHEMMISTISGASNTFWLFLVLLLIFLLGVEIVIFRATLHSFQENQSKRESDYTKP